MNTQQNQKSNSNDIYLEEYKALRDEILLRAREKNRTINHVILLISALRQLTNNNLPIFPHLIYILIFHQITTGKNTGTPYIKIWAKL